MKLPPQFLTKMQSYLGEEYDSFIASYARPRIAGLRVNRLKINPLQLKELLPYLTDQVPWCNDGFYYNEGEVRPAKNPFFYGGLYYIQEPSAMLPAQMLESKPGQRILDLCAAPGGKSVQLAAQLEREGLLVVNDINGNRAKALLKNIERYGVINAIVLNETPDKIARVFAGFFDKILIDAPCSGEGMFHKEPDMAKDWSEIEVAKYASWQADILNVVPLMLRPGGEVVYSTCTFSREENEGQINQFLQQNHDFLLLESRRLWPHHIRGEGHFAAKLKRKEHADIAPTRTASQRPQLTKSSQQAIEAFSLQVWGHSDKWRQWLPSDGVVVERAGHVLWESNLLPSLAGIKALRTGWLIGTIEKGRFKPSQAYAMGLPSEALASAVQKCRFTGETEAGRYEAIRYLRGETLQQEGKDWPSGWHLIAIDDYALGWAKSAGSWLKNEYPPGWRWED